MDDELIATLPPISRLALAYAPARSRADWLTLLALDARLAGIIRQSREPVLARIRLAWWRDTLQQKAASRPQGEPLLARLADWPGAGLVALVDGWEALLADPPIVSSAISAFAAGREGAVIALAARSSANGQGLTALARRWALADLAVHLGEAVESRAVSTLLLETTRPSGRVARAMRPLAVLERVSSHAAARGDVRAQASPAALLIAIRSGLIGR